MSEKQKQWLTKTWVVCLLAMICCVLWGSAFPGIKLGYEWWRIPSADTGTVILFAGTRFTLAGVLTILIGSLLQGKFLLPTRDAIPSVVILSLFQTVLQYLFFYIGLAHTSGVKASIIEAANVFLAIIVASIFLHQEKINVGKMIGCVIGFAGVVLVNLQSGGITGKMSLKGEGFILLSTLAAAISSALIKQFSKKYSPVMLSGYQFVVGGIVMMIWGMASGGRLTEYNGKGIAVLIYLALVSAIAYSVWSILLKYNPVSKVAVFGFMNPIAGVLLSAVFLQEKSQASGIVVILALALVSIGIYVVNRE